MADVVELEKRYQEVMPIETPFYELIPDLESLLPLRLVSRSWHAAVTRNLVKCRHDLWSVNFDKPASLQRALRCFEPDVAGKTPFASPVWKLELPFQHDKMCTLMPFTRHYREDTLEEDDEGERVLNQRYAEMLVEGRFERHPMYDDVLKEEAKHFHNDLSAENRRLGQLFAAVPQIKAFSLYLPEASTSEGNPTMPPRWYNMAFCYDMQVSTTSCRPSNTASDCPPSASSSTSAWTCPALTT